MNQTLLLVEDSPDDIALALRAFRKANLPHPVQVVEDGQAAIDYLSGAGEYADRERHPLPALILLDLNLPRKSGFEVLEWLRRQPRPGRPPIVVLTGSKASADLARAYDLGANSYLVKPVAPAALREVVNSLPFLPGRPLRLLLIDNDDDDRALTARELRREFPGALVEEAVTPDDIARALDAGGYDLVITDFNAPGWSGLNNARAIKARDLDCPVIVFTGTAAQEELFEALDAGVDDYVLKSPPAARARLPVAARAALGRARARRALRESEEKFSKAFHSNPAMLVLAALDGRNVDVNQAYADFLGYSREEMLGKSIVDPQFISAAERQKILELLQRADGSLHNAEIAVQVRDGSLRHALLSVEVISLGGAPHRLVTLLDITERKRAEDAVHRQRDELAARDRIISATVQTQDLGELLNIVLREATALLGVEFGLIYLVEGRHLVLHAWRGISDEHRAQAMSFPLDQAAEFKAARLVRERLSEQGITPDFVKREGIQAWGNVPLTLPARGGEDAQGDWLGVLMLASRSYEGLTEEDARTLQAVAEQLALTIDHARNYREAQQRLVRLRVLREIDLAIISRQSIREIMTIVLQHIPAGLGAEAAAVSLLEADSLRTQVFAMRLPNGAVVEEEAFTLAESLLHWFVEREEEVIIHDLALEPRVQMHREVIRQHKLVSYLGVPLVVRGHTTGILHIFTTTPKVFTDEDVAFFRTLAGQAAIAIENVHLFDQLQASERKFRALIENSSDGIALVGAEGTILYGSPSTARILGYSDAERVGRSAFELMHADELDANRNLFAQMLKEPGVGIPGQLRVRRKDGEWRWMELVGTNCLAVPGVGGIVINFRDATERVRAETEIRLLQTTTQAVGEAPDFHAALRVALERVCQATGWQYGEAWIPRPDGSALEPSPVWYSGDLTLEHFRKVAERFTFPPGRGLPGRVWSSKRPEWLPDVSVDGEVFLRAPSAAQAGLKAALGVPMPASKAPAGPKAGLGIPVLNGERVMAVLVFFMFEAREEDRRLVEIVSAAAAQLGAVLQRKQAEEAVRQSEERYRTLAEAAHDHIFVVNHEGVVEYANQFAASQFGRRPEELIGQKTEAIFPPEVNEVQRSSVQRVIQARQPLYFEHKSALLQGEVWLGTWLSPLFNEAGEVRAALGISRDITERKQAEADLHASEERFSKAFRASPVAISLTTFAEGRFVDVNDSFLKLLGGPARDEIIGRTVLDIGAGVSPEYRAPLAQALREHGRVSGLEAQFTTLAGETRDVLASLELIELGGEACILTLAHDITERKLAEAPARLRAGQMAIAGEVGRALAETLALGEIYDRFYQAVLRLLPDSKTVFISLFDPAQNVFRCVFAMSEGERIDHTSLPPVPLEPPGVGTQSETYHTRRPVVVNDLPARLQRVRVNVNVGDEDRMAQSGLYVPMLAKGRFIGALMTQSLALNRYTEADASLLSLVANTAAIAIENARLLDETRRRLAELEAVNRISIALRAAETLTEMLPLLLNETLAALECEAGVIWLHHPESGELRAAAARGWFTGLDETPMRPGEGIAGAVFASGRAHTSREFASDPLARPSAVEKIPGGWGGVCLPVRAAAEVIGALFVAAPLPRELTPDEVRVLTTLAELAGNATHRATLHEQTRRDALELALAYDTTIEGWSRALDLRDRETEGHTQRVTEMTLRLARAMGMSESERVHLRRGALLHDIGKMGIPDVILLKPGPLTGEEWAVMHEHPRLAYDMLLPIAYLRPALDIPYCHHEKWDGSGYPRGLKGEQIPLAARLFAVADVWDALRSDRPYRQGWPEDKVREYIRAQTGAHFDPKAVELFFQVSSENAPERKQGAG